MSRAFLRALACFFVCLLICAIPSRPAGCDARRFSDDAAAFYQAASSFAAKPATDVVVLCDEEDFAFDAQGKAVHTRYVLYKVLTQHGAEAWDALSVDWRPWNDDKPIVRARVISPDNVVHVLDDKTISEGPLGEENQKLYSDRRVLRAPLPAVAPGSVVEEEDVRQERALFFTAGVVSVDYFGRGVPVQQSRLLLDAPTTLPLHYRASLLPDLKTNRSEANGRAQLIFEQGPMEALDDIETYLPSDAPGHPQIAFSNGNSWQAVAETYANVVDKQIDLKDVEPLVKKVVAGKGSRQEKAFEILQYLSREVRYTGVEFGESAVVPHTPAETLQRKYGDCKDKSVLLTAMLRASGVPAYLALLNVGMRKDVESALPGLGTFDHAIVFAPGSPDLWIDATDGYARLGQIPAADQGRFALIARAGTTELVRTPETSSQENSIIETREFRLAEYGPARVVENTQAKGVFESQFRAFYADEANKDATNNLTDYVKAQYLAEKLSRMERSDPADLSKPFRLVVEADRAKRGFTDLEIAVVAIRLESIFQRLPTELQQREPVAEKPQDEKGKPKKPRAHDYQLSHAFTVEWRYQIVPPLGFQLKPLPPNKNIPLGPAVLTEEFQSQKDGSVAALVRFDTVKRRFTVAEATALRTKVAELREGQPTLIYFEPVWQSLLSQGRVREASQSIRDLIAQHPKEAVHHLQRAQVLLVAGMGQAARQESRLAVNLEPRSALAQKSLAEILKFDLVGREYKRGSDLAGARAAYREAIRLDPEDKSLVQNLALLLEYNDDGERYGTGADLKEATSQYRSLSAEDLNSSGLKNNPAFTLFYSGEFAEAKRYAETLNPQPGALIVAAEAAMNGTQAGISEARRRTEGEDNLKTMLKPASEMLVHARKYNVAADLMEVSASGNNASTSMALAAMLRKAQPHRQQQFKDDPSGLLQRFFVLLCDAQLTPQRMNSFSSRNAQRVMRNSDPQELKKMETTGRQLRTLFSRSGLGADAMVDIVMAAMQIQVTGDDSSGYRVSMQAPGSKNLTLFVVKEDGQYKLLDSADKPNSMALEIMDSLQAQDTRRAKILLDWVREEQHVAGGDDLLAGFAFPRMWAKGKDVDLARMKLAGAALLAETKETAREALPLLEAARNHPANDSDKLNVTLALLDAYRNLEEYAKLDELAADLAKQYPDSKRLFADQEFALNGLGHFAQADALSQGLLERLPNDLDAMRALVTTAAIQENYVLARDRGLKIAQAGKAEAADLNDIAWNALFTGKVDQADLDSAIKGAQMSQNGAPVLHTLGCIYADMGNTKQAREVLIQAMDALTLDEPDSNYWYAFGRIAEQYGERAEALQDYNRVEKPSNPLRIPSSSYRLAQIRLNAMQRAPVN